MARDPISQAALDYLEATHGIQEADIWELTVDASQTSFTVITVKMIIPDSMPTPTPTTIVPLVCSDEYQPTHTPGSRPDGCGTCGGGRDADAPAPKRHPALAAAHAVQFTKGAQRGHVVGRGDATMVPLVPTVCQRADPQGAVCGEVIRWSEANGWYHVGDHALGQAGHSATPPPVAPGVPTSAVRRTMDR